MENTTALEAKTPSGNDRCQKVNANGSQCRYALNHGSTHGFDKRFNKTIK